MKTTMRMMRMITAVSALWYFFRRTEAAVGGQAILPDAGIGVAIHAASISLGVRHLRCSVLKASIGS
jgi:hypothetical protein